MQAVVDDARLGSCKAVTTGEPIKTVQARDLMRQISEATWECADPGMQFDTTINRWHTAPNTGRINAQQPVLRVHAPRQLGVQPRQHQPAEVPRRRRRVRRRGLPAHRRGRCSPRRRSWSATPTTRPSRSGRRAGSSASSASATPTSARCSWRRACPYDSPEGRAWAAAITALMTGHAYATSARTAGRMGPFAGYAENADADARTCCACTAPRRPRSTRSSCPPELLSSAAQRGVGRRGRARRALRRAQLAGHRARAHRHDRPDDGLRHHRHRARPRAHEGEEARRRRHDVHRQPDDPAGAAPPRLLRRAGRRRSSPTSTSTRRSSARPSSTPSTCRCSRARWATTRSTTWVTSR